MKRKNLVLGVLFTLGATPALAQNTAGEMLTFAAAPHILVTVDCSSITNSEPLTTQQFKTKILGIKAVYQQEGSDLESQVDALSQAYQNIYNAASALSIPSTEAAAKKNAQQLASLTTNFNTVGATIQNYYKILFGGNEYQYICATYNYLKAQGQAPSLKNITVNDR